MGGDRANPVNQKHLQKARSKNTKRVEPTNNKNNQQINNDFMSSNTMGNSMKSASHQRIKSIETTHMTE